MPSLSTEMFLHSESGVLTCSGSLNAKTTDAVVGSAKKVSSPPYVVTINNSILAMHLRAVFKTQPSEMTLWLVNATDPRELGFELESLTLMIDARRVARGDTIHQTAPPFSVFRSSKDIPQLKAVYVICKTYIAQGLSPMLTVLPWSSSASAMIRSRKILKRAGESRQPWRSPTVVLNHLPMLLLKNTAMVAFPYGLFVIKIMLAFM
ncbi:hypothetical protein PoB_007577500 [Plakobranchus ocellatus]|uniref:Uncharacterized protein n=1 Tax=Plakobranchus ocellatus TaxID=259542 RepID=A0AAV4DYK1_9GAST|nr:hypothetical protein PoB_007577500 [Plakobranchus ocellatus]